MYEWYIMHLRYWYTDSGSTDQGLATTPVVGNTLLAYFSTVLLLLPLPLHQASIINCFEDYINEFYVGILTWKKQYQ